MPRQNIGPRPKYGPTLQEPRRSTRLPTLAFLTALGAPTSRSSLSLTPWGEGASRRGLCCDAPLPPATAAARSSPRGGARIAPLRHVPLDGRLGGTAGGGGGGGGERFPRPAATPGRKLSEGVTASWLPPRSSPPHSPGPPGGGGAVQLVIGGGEPAAGGQQRSGAPHLLASSPRRARPPPNALLREVETLLGGGGEALGGGEECWLAAAGGGGG